jgi:hypothetical protein
MQNKGSLYVGSLLILAGLVFLFISGAERLLRPLGISLGWHNLWPLLLLLAGLAFWLPIVIWWSRRGELAGLAVPASLFTANGLILLYTAVTRRWGDWTFLWALEPVALGLAFLLLYYLTDRPKGLWVVGAVFVGIGGFFFFVFASAFGGLAGLIAPLFLIALGLVLLMRGRLFRSGGARPEEL